jgi:peroxiredoxin Q/BCP
VTEPSRLSVGDPAPPFSLPTDDGTTVSLADFAGQRVIVYFYPAALTPGCTKQASDFQATLGSFQAEGYAVVGISPDKSAKITRFREQDGLTFPLLSDVDHEVMTAYGAFGEKQLYGRTVVGVIRSTFVIDVDAEGRGTIALAQYNVKATGHVAKLRRDLALD